MKRHIPNALTCANLLCGTQAAVYGLAGQYSFALGLIVLGAVFDFFDGFVARLLKVQGPMGKELDSLADVVTFGVAPSFIVMSWLTLQLSNENNPSFFNHLPLLALLIAAFSALRLAKFNIDTRQSDCFIGLPTPANALFWAAFIASIDLFDFAGYGSLTTGLVLLAFVGIGIFFSCWILVSEVPMFALKFKTFAWRDNQLRYLFLLASLVLIIGALLAGWNYVGISASILLYVLLSVATQRHTVTE